jgi:hypothetical protein
MSESERKVVGLATEMCRHPLARRWTHKVMASGDNKVYTAADVLGERLLRLGGMLLAVLAEPESIRVNVPQEKKLDALVRLARFALTASPYLWTEEVRHALARSLGPGPSPQLPRHVISSRLLPAPRMWWTFETGIGLGPTREGGEIVADAVAVRDSVDAVEVLTLGSIYKGERPDGIGRAPGEQGFVEGLTFRYGKTYPDDFIDSPGRVQLASVLGFLAFLNSPYIPKTQARLTRPERREIARRKAPEMGEEVTFITLRRPEPPRHHREEPTPTAVDWQHRWVVSGHYRAQWYPSEAAHHVIWIAPYLKGPEDAPLVEHAFRVAR